MPNREQQRNRASGGRLEGVFGSLLVHRFIVRQPEMYRIIEVASKLTALNIPALCELAQTAMDIEFDNLDGDFIQVGCGSGGAAIVIAHAKRRSRTFLVHDAFGAGTDAHTKVRRALSDHGADGRSNVRLFFGPYEETLAREGPVALAHLDCGEYATMRALLERVTGMLVPGAHLIIDDYKTSEECKRAVDEHFRGKKSFQFVRKSRLHVIRNKK